MEESYVGVGEGDVFCDVEYLVVEVGIEYCEWEDVLIDVIDGCGYE